MRGAARPTTRTFEKDQKRTSAAIAVSEGLPKGSVSWSHLQVPLTEDRTGTALASPRTRWSGLPRPRGRPHGNRVRRRLARVPLFGEGGAVAAPGVARRTPGLTVAKWASVCLPSSPQDHQAKGTLPGGCGGHAGRLSPPEPRRVPGGTRNQTCPGSVGFRQGLPVRRTDGRMR